MVRTILKEFGLTENAVKVYLTCLNLWESLAWTIAKKCNLNRSSIYILLDKLTKSWIIGSVLKNKVSYFYAVSPDLLLELCRNNLYKMQSTYNKMEKIVPTLNQMWLSTNSIDVKVYKGLDNVTRSYTEFILLVPLKWTIYNYVSPATTNDLDIKTIIKDFIKIRKKKGIFCKSICTYCKDAFILKAADKYENRETLVSFENETWTFSSETLINENWILEMSYSNWELHSCLTINKDISNMRLGVFKMAWKQAKNDDKELLLRPEAKNWISEFKSTTSF